MATRVAYLSVSVVWIYVFILSILSIFATLPVLTILVSVQFNSFLETFLQLRTRERKKEQLLSQLALRKDTNVNMFCKKYDQILFFYCFHLCLILYPVQKQSVSITTRYKHSSV